MLNVSALKGMSIEDQLKEADKYAGVAEGTHASLWKQESGMGQNLIGPKTKWGHAKGHFQALDNVWENVQSKYGAPLDRMDFTQSLVGAAMMMKENMGKYGDEAKAIMAYHGGWNEKNWGPKTKTYVEQVTARIKGTSKAVAALPVNAEVGVPTAAPVSWDDAFRGRGIPAVSAADLDTMDKEAGVTLPQPFAQPSQEPSPSVMLAAKARVEGEAKEAKRASQERWGLGRDTTFGAAVSQAVAPTANLWAHAVAGEDLYDADFVAERKANPRAVYGYVENPTPEEKELLDSTRSRADLALALTKINTDREDAATLGNVSGTEAFLIGTLGQLADPVGWAAGFGVSKAFAIAGYGARALMAQGSGAASAVSLAAENAAGNVLTDVALAAMGEHRDLSDYAMSGLAGAAMSLPFMPSTVRAAHAEAQLKAQREAWNKQAPFFARASDELGPGATTDAVRELAKRYINEDAERELAARTAQPAMTRRIDAPDLDDPDLLAGLEATELKASDVSPGEASPNFSADAKMVADIQLEAKVDMYKITRSADELRTLSPGIHLGADVATSPAFKEIAVALETYRAKYAPDLAIHLQRGDAGVLGTMDGAATSAGAGKHIIMLKGGEQMQPTAFHELGHAVFEHYAAKLPDDLRSKLIADWRAWADEFETNPDAASVARARMGASRASSKTVIGAAIRGELDVPLKQALREAFPDPAKAESYARYFTKLDEFAAEQFLKQVESDLAEQAAKAALTPAQKLLGHLANLLKTMKALFDELRGKGQLKPSEGFGEFLARAAKGELQGSQGAVSGRLAGDIAPAGRDAIDSKYGLDLIDQSDVNGRLRYKQIKALRAQAEEWLANNPQDAKRLRTMLDNKFFDASLPGHVLAASDDPLAKMYAALVVEDAQGAGGRHDTAAIRKFMNTQSYVGNSLVDFNREFSGWAAGEASLADRATDALFKGQLQERFNRLVATEIENRLWKRPLSKDGHVTRAADAAEAAFERMRVAQVSSKTSGWGALPHTSVGYMPHRFNAAKLLALTVEQQRAVQGVIKQQLLEFNAFDDVFADKVSKAYLDHARVNANAGHEIPGNMHDPAAAHYVEQAMRAAGMTKAEIDAFAGKLRAGAMSHTKKRLKLDLTARYGEGQGFLLMDLYHTDLPSLIKAQAERVGGEVALTQSGIMGSAGLRLIEDALHFKPDTVTPEAHAKMMQAFQQTAAEMLDRPWQPSKGGAMVWMDRALTANSLSSLGGMGFAQLQEGVNMGLTLGISHAMSSLSSVPRLLAEVKALAKGEKVPNGILSSMEQFGGGGEFGMQDYKMVLKLDDPGLNHTAVGQDGITAVDRALRLGSHALGALSFHRITNAVQVRSAAEQITKKALRFIKEGKDSKALADMGFTPELAAKVRQELDTIAVWSGGNLKEFDITKMKDTEAASQFVTAVHRGSRQIIQGMFVGEKHRWQHSALGRMLTQFRVFPLVAMEKQLGRNLAVHGAAGVLGMVVAALPFVMALQGARVAMAAAGRPDAEDYIDKHMSPVALAKASMNYLGVLGLLPDVVDGLTAVLPEGVVPEALQGGAGQGRYGMRSPTTASLVPIVGWGDRVVRATTNIGEDGAVDKLRQITPLNNTPLLMPLSNLLRNPQ